MAIPNRILPGTRTEVLDGSILSSVTLPTDLALVIGRAYKGPSNTIYNVTSTKDAAAIFGIDSPIIAQMSEVLAGGAKNVALYRVGGQAPTIANLFGVGSNFSTLESSSQAADSLKVYIGPEHFRPTFDTVIITNGKQIVYSDALGGEVNLGTVLFDSFSKTDNTVYVGSANDPVPFAEVINEAGRRIVTTATDSPTITLPNYNAETASKYGLTVAVNGTPTTKYTLTGNTITLDPEYVATLSSGYTVEVSYIQKFTAEEKESMELSYIAGQDLMDATWQEYYEAFDTALANLYATDVKVALIGDVFNVPNLAQGSTEKDALSYLNLSIDEFGDRKYEWSKDQVVYVKAGTTTDETTSNIYEAQLNSNGRPIIAKQYHEVDFVHRAGQWAYERTMDSGYYINVVAGAIGPQYTTPRHIAAWLGRLPTFDQVTGKLLINGTGIRGNKFAVGTTEYAGGYFATSSGFPDGPALTDSAGTVVDLGKYISVVVAQVYNQASNQMHSGAAVYAGLITNLTPGNGSTNVIVPAVVNAIPLKQAQLVDINNIGYVAFVDKPKGLTVLSGTLMTRSTSDFEYISTSLAMNAVTRDIKEVCDPYIGKGLDGVLMVSLHTALHTRLAARQSEGYFTDYTLSMTQLGPNTIKVRYRITGKDELREVSNEIKLNAATISTTTLN